MDCYLTLPINERKLQELVADAKDFMYGLGKEFDNMFFDYLQKMTIWSLCIFLFI